MVITDPAASPGPPLLARLWPRIIRQAAPGLIDWAVAAGGIEFTKADEPMLIGRDEDDVLEYERTSPTASEVLAGLSPAQGAELTRQVRNHLAAYVSPGAVTMPGAAWLVTAQAV
jgi:hypothetical protein